MNVVFLGIVIVAFVTAAWREIGWVGDELSPMESLSKAVIESAAGSVELALGLIGVMTLFLGLMKVAEAGGLLRILAALIRPLMVRLFPEVPAQHPAMGAMILNLSANAMGLGTAATPFGIRAMQDLDRLNPRPGTATDSMALFLAYVNSLLKDKREVTMFNYAVSKDLVLRALLILLFGLVSVLGGMLVLSVTESAPFIFICFETVSAFGTVGLSAGITPALSIVGKYVIILLMFIGRIGPLTLLAAAAQRLKQAQIEYPTGEILVG